MRLRVRHRVASDHGRKILRDARIFQMQKNLVPSRRGRHGNLQSRRSKRRERLLHAVLHGHAVLLDIPVVHCARALTVLFVRKILPEILVHDALRRLCVDADAQSVHLLHVGNVVLLRQLQPAGLAEPLGVKQHSVHIKYNRSDHRSLLFVSYTGNSDDSGSTALTRTLCLPSLTGSFPRRPSDASSPRCARSGTEDS